MSYINNILYTKLKIGHLFYIKNVQVLLH